MTSVLDFVKCETDTISLIEFRTTVKKMTKEKNRKYSVYHACNNFVRSFIHSLFCDKYQLRIEKGERIIIYWAVGRMRTWFNEGIY